MRARCHRRHGTTAWIASLRFYVRPARKRFTLAAHLHAPQARFAVRFPTLAISTPGDRAWLAIAPAGGASPPYESWILVENGARSVTLEAPATPDLRGAALRE